MLKNKAVNQLVNNIVVTSLLIGTLTAGLPLNGQAQKTGEHKNLRMEINQKIKDIEHVVTNFKRAKKIIPFAIAAIGVTIIIIAGFIGIVAWMHSKGKLSKKLEDINIDAHLLETEFYSLEQKSSQLYEQYKTTMKELTHLETALVKIQKEAPHYKTRQKKIADIGTELKKIMAEATEKNASIMEKNDLIQEAVETMKSIESQIKTGKRRTFFSILVALATSVVAPLLTFAAFKFLSKTAIKKASRGLTELEQIEKEHPHILTEQQKNIVTQFKKLYKNPTTLGIIQGLKLKNALISVADTAMQQHPSFAATLDKKKGTRQIITTYIKLKWQEEKLQKAAAQHIAMKKSGFKPFITKFQLNRKKNKIKNLEAQYPMLKNTLKNAVQSYTIQVEAILEELREQVMKTEELEKSRVPLQPTISL